MKAIKFNVRTYDEKENLVDNDNYKSITDIHKSYPDIPYGTINYIAYYYDNDISRKPSKQYIGLCKNDSKLHT